MADFRQKEIKDDSGDTAKPMTLVVSELLEGDNLKFQRKIDDDTILAVDPEGRKATIKLSEYIPGILEDEQIDPLSVKQNLVINTPDSAADQSTLSEARRAQLALGTFGQKVSKLQELYGKDNVDYRPDQGLLYKEGNTWYKVDAGEGLLSFQNKKGEFDIDINTDFYKQYEDNWRELSRDIADFPDLIINALATTYTAGKGAAGGALAGAPLGPVGSFVGSGIGGIGGAGLGGAASLGIRSVLGKIAGLGDADPNELKEELVIETMMAMGGQGLAWGAKPTLQGVIKGIQGLKNGTDNVGKEVISGILGSYSRAGSDVIKKVIEEPAEWGMRLKSYAEKSIDAEDLSRNAFNSGVDNTKKLVELAVDNLPKKWKESFDVVTSSPKINNLKINTDAFITNPAEEVAKKGFGNIVKTGNRFIFKPLSEQEFMLRQSQGLPAELLDDVAVKEINSIVSKMSKFAGKELEGKAAANTLVGINKSLNQLTKDSFKSQISPSTQRFISQLSASYKNVVRESFNNADLGLEYKAMQDVYETFAKPVKYARTVLSSNNQNEISNLFKQINSELGVQEGKKATVNLWKELAGEEGEKLAKDIAWDYAIYKTAPWAPKIGPVQALGILGTGGTAGLAQASPRIAANEAALLSRTYKLSGKLLPQGLRDAANNVWKLPEIDYSLMTLDTIKSLSPAAKKQLMGDPVLLRSMLSAPAMAIEGEFQDTELMNQYIQDSLNKAQ